MDCRWHSVLDYLIDPVKNPDLPTLLKSWTGLVLPPIASPLVMTVGVLALGGGRDRDAE